MEKRHYRTKPIDGEKLRAELRQRNITMLAASHAIGHGNTYIKNAVDAGRLSESSIMLLEHLYHIDPDLYVVPEKSDEPEPEVVEVQSVPQQIELVWDDRKLYALINNAVFNAIKRAFGEATESAEE